MVSIVLFSVGGMFSILEGVEKLTHPHELTDAWIPLTVLGIAIVLESFSLRTALRAAKEVRGRSSLYNFIRHAKSPELPVVILEDIAALLGLVFAFGGVGLTVLTHDAAWDAIGTLAIGALLIVVAIVLGIETSSLLVGEGATANDTQMIAKALRESEGVEDIIHMKTLYLGPEELMVAAKIAVKTTDKAADIAKAIDIAEANIRKAVPTALVIYLEPDILRSSKN
jgi:divalent metal cation (Fe/Co/Zn/Cd) transporter